jgi:hypothetical protein
MNIQGVYTGIVWPADFVAAGVQVPSLNEFMAGECAARDRSRGVLSFEDERKASRERRRYG